MTLYLFLQSNVKGFLSAKCKGLLNFCWLGIKWKCSLLLGRRSPNHFYLLVISKNIIYRWNYRKYVRNFLHPSTQTHYNDEKTYVTTTIYLPPLSLALAALSVWGQAPVWSWSSSSSWRGWAPRGRGRHRGPGGGCWSTMASCCSWITASSLQESRDSWWHSQVSCLTDCHRLPVLSSTISC